MREYTAYESAMTSLPAPSMLKTEETPVREAELFEGGLSPSLYYMMIGYLTTGSIGIAGNVLVLVVIFRFTAMRKQVTNMLIINQSVADTLVSVVVVAKYSFDILSDYDMSAFGSEILCRLWTSTLFVWGVSLVSTYNLVAVSIERYLKVVHPVFHRNHFTKTRAIIAITAVWTLGLGYTFATVIPTSAIYDDYCYTWAIFPDESWLAPMGLVHISVEFFIPVAAMVYCYTHMLVVLRRRSKVSTILVAPAGQRSGPKTATTQDKNLSRAQKNLIKTFLIVTICFIFCWFWNEFWFLLWNFGYRTSWHTNPVGYESALAMVFVNSCINPFIYLFKYREFQKGAKKLFCCQSQIVIGSTTKASDQQRTQGRQP